MTRLIVILAFALIPIACSKQQSKMLRTRESVGGKIPNMENCLLCHVGRLEVQYEQSRHGTDDNFYVCEIDPADDPDGKANQMYILENLPQSFLQQHKDRLENGNSSICLPDGKANKLSNRVEFSSHKLPKYVGERQHDKHGHRQLLNFPTGRHTVLAVVVSSTAGENDPNVNATVMTGNLFGLGPMAQSVNVASQYKACSHGRLLMQPATGNNVVNGVLELTIPISITGSQTLLLQNTLVSATNAALGIQEIRRAANHIMFCLPTGSIVGTSRNWASFAYTNGQISFFQISLCASLSSPMHELGHNIGFMHAGLASTSDEYGDRSGYMGYVYPISGHPIMCFNAHKNWLSGWFNSRQVSVNPFDGSWTGNLVSIVDYTKSTSSDGAVLINADNLYMQLNSAKSYNNETKTNPNQVNIVVADQPTRPNTRSWLLAGLSAGKSYMVANFNRTGVPLVIQVCDIFFGTIDVAQVSIFLNDGIQTSGCGRCIVGCDRHVMR